MDLQQPFELFEAVVDALATYFTSVIRQTQNTDHQSFCKGKNNQTSV